MPNTPYGTTCSKQNIHFENQETAWLFFAEKTILTYFIPLIFFWTPWKQKTMVFLMFFGVIERDQWHEMVNQDSKQQISFETRC